MRWGVGGWGGVEMRGGTFIKHSFVYLCEDISDMHSAITKFKSVFTYYRKKG